jgi:hypothetical protein
MHPSRLFHIEEAIFLEAAVLSCVPHGRFLGFDGRFVQR